MFKSILILGMLVPLGAFAKVQLQKVSALTKLNVDDSHWSLVETERMFTSKIPIFFNKRNEDVFGPVFSQPLVGYAVSRPLEEVRNSECVSDEFKHDFIIVQKDKRFICDITFSKDGKDYRQLWIIDRVGEAGSSSFTKTVISFSTEKEFISDLNIEVDGLKRTIAGGTP